MNWRLIIEYFVKSMLKTAFEKTILVNCCTTWKDMGLTKCKPLHMISGLTNKPPHQPRATFQVAKECGLKNKTPSSLQETPTVCIGLSNQCLITLKFIAAVKQLAF